MTEIHRLWHRRPSVLDGLDGIMSFIMGPSKNQQSLDGEKDLPRDEEIGRSNNQLKARALTGGDSQGRATVIEVVYKTLSPTFEGPIAGYSTLEWVPPQPTPTPMRAPDSPHHQLSPPTPTKHADASLDQASSPTPQPNPTPSVPRFEETVTPEAKKSSSLPELDTGIPTMIRPPSDTPSVDSVLAQATGTPSPSPTLAIDHKGLPSAMRSSAPLATNSATAANMTSPTPDNSSGASAGEKAGIAFGVAGGVFIVALIAFIIFRRRKQSQRHRLDDDEKGSEYGGGIGAQEFLRDARGSNPTAPRISLRPVTQFLPNWNLDRHASREPDGALSPGPATSSIYSDRPITTHSTRSVNPFGNHAERAPSPIREEDEGSLKSPVPTNRGLTKETRAMPGTQVGTAAAAAAGAGAVAGGPVLKRMTSMNRTPKQVDLTTPSKLAPIPASPAGTEGSVYSTAFGPPPSPTMGASAIAAAGGPANSTIHRVQLAFKPTLEDEMELKTGELIWLLHEYDDGWALVIRLDRSQQGVVPRTCFSARPVKPRLPQNRPPVIPSGLPKSPATTPLSPLPPASLPPLTQSNGASSATKPQNRMSGLPPLTSPTLPVTALPRLPSLLSPEQAPPAGAGSLDRKPAPGQAF